MKKYMTYYFVNGCEIVICHKITATLLIVPFKLWRNEKKLLSARKTVYGVSAGTSKSLQSCVPCLSFEAALLNLDSRDSVANKTSNYNNNIST